MSAIINSSNGGNGGGRVVEGMIAGGSGDGGGGGSGSGPSSDVVMKTTAAAVLEEAGGSSGKDVTTAARMTTTTTTRDDDGIDRRGGGRRTPKALMSNDKLFEFFERRLGMEIVCPNEGCLCLSMMLNPGACVAVAKYLVWFERLSKYAQDTIVFEWVKYASQAGRTGRYHWYHAPFDSNIIAGDQAVLEFVRTCKLCVTGMKFEMRIGQSRF
jgi:hypothetical protein